MTTRNELASLRKPALAEKPIKLAKLQETSALESSVGTQEAAADQVDRSKEDLVPFEAESVIGALPENRILKAATTLGALVHTPEKSSQVGRGVVIYVALSLTEAQSVRATAWAAAAECSIGFLIRRVAQSVRREVVAEWSAGQILAVERSRQSHPTLPISVTLTLPAPLAKDLISVLDPFRILGLSRAIAPLLRARFETAFDTACQRAGF